jgi:outer membrane biosynthesis protein TonB
MSHSDQQKNARAGTYTGIVCGLLLLLFFIVSWTIPSPIKPQEDLGMEVNLGNSDIGSGDVQPLIPEAPAKEEREVNTPPKTQVTTAEPVKEVNTDDNDKEAPEAVVHKPAKPEPKATKLPEKEKTVPVKVVAKPSPKIVDNPAPAPPKPKFIYKGGDGGGKGGNNADTWNGSTSQGIAGGKGDQGKINGNPNSDSYTGNGGSGHSGVSISKGLTGRRITRLPSFEDDFNENAKVAVDIHVDQNGNVLSASYQPRGSTTSDAGLREIAIRKAKSLKFSANANAAENEIGTIVFNFHLKN